MALAEVRAPPNAVLMGCVCVCVRCSGCEVLVQNLEEQVLKANTRRDRQLQINKDVEQEARTT